MTRVSPRPRSVDDLRELERDGQPLPFLFFWGHRPPRDGGVGPGCLSQWWPARFTLDGVDYPTAEHAMMAGKARLFADADAEARILADPDPKAAKAFGRQVRSFDQATWQAHRYRIVVAANLAKFGQHPSLGAFLLGTDDQVLVEASPYDRVWGIGLAAGDERASRPSTWRGRNLLGFALMDVRDTLRSEPGGTRLP